MRRRLLVGMASAGVTLLAAAGSVGAQPGATAEAWKAAAAARAALEHTPVAGGQGPGEPPELVNDEVGLATLDPTGLPVHAVLVSRVAGTGGRREIIDPASQTNVRYLDRLGRPEVTPEGVVLAVGGQRPTALTEARFDKPLPVALHAEYALDGRIVPATEVPGAAADVSVTYTLTNTEAQQVRLEYTDAAGQLQQSTRPVFAPFQGTLTVTLPEDAELLDPGGAVLATDEKGRTVARWNITLYPPISAPIQEVGMVMRTGSAAIPGAEVVLTPIESGQDAAEELAGELFTATNEGNAELYAGLAELDRGAAAVAGGSAELAAGVGALAGGAGGVASGSAALAGGLGSLTDGAEQVAEASAGLASGLGDLSGGAGELSEGSAQLAGALAEAVIGADALAATTAELAASTTGDGTDPVAPLSEAGTRIEAGLVEATARVGSPEDPVLGLTEPLPPDDDDVCPSGGVAPPDDDCVTIYQGVRQLRDGLAALNQVVDALGGRAEQAQAALDEVLAALGSIGSDITTAAEGAAALVADLCTPPTATLDEPTCARLQAVAEAAADAVDTAAGSLPSLDDVAAAVDRLERQTGAFAAAVDLALASTERLLAGVEELGVALGQGTADQPGLTAGMAALNAGLRQLSAALATAQAQLGAALTEVAAGNATLAAGLEDGAGGAGALATGSAALSEGADRAERGADRLEAGAQGVAAGSERAADGAGRVADGAAALAQGSQDVAAAGTDLATGAAQLRSQGTAPAAEAVLDSSTDPAEAAAWLAAADARAGDALPYGAPEGAIGHVAYVFTMPEVAAPRGWWDRIRAMLGA